MTNRHIITKLGLLAIIGILAFSSCVPQKKMLLLKEMEMARAKVVQTADAAERVAHALHQYVYDVCSDIQQEQGPDNRRNSHFLNQFL